jgi:signal peptidase II
LDQITKWFVLHHVHPEEPGHVVIPDVFSLVNVTNDGAAFGSFKNNNTFFIVLSCVAFVVVLALLIRRRSPDALRDISLALLLAGIMGNLTDRFIHGHVIDFLLFDLHIPLRIFRPWPAFNVADSCICIAVVCFIIHSFRQPRKSAAENAT